MFGGELAQAADTKRLRHPVHGQLIVSRVVHMPVEIDITVGHSEIRYRRSSCLAQPSGKRQLISGDDLFDIDVVHLRKDDPAGIRVDQDPERSRVHEHLAPGIHEAEIAGEIQVHCFSGPGQESDLLVIHRHAVKFHPVLRHSPQKTLVQRLVSCDAQFDGVRDRGFLQARKKRGQAQSLRHIHITGQDLKVLSVHSHGSSFTTHAGSPPPKHRAQPRCSHAVRDRTAHAATLFAALRTCG